MKQIMLETFQKFGGLGVTRNSQELFIKEVLNGFYDNGLIDGKTYEATYDEKIPEEKVEEVLDGAPPRGVGPIPAELRPIKEVTAEVVEEKVVEAEPEKTKETPKKENKSKTKSKTKSKKKSFGWLGE